MNAITGTDLGTRLCRVLGLDPSKVAGMRIIIDVDDLVMVRVDEVVTDEESGALMHVLGDYHLVKIDGISEAVISDIVEQELEGYAPQGAEPVGLLSVT